MYNTTIIFIIECILFCCVHQSIFYIINLINNRNTLSLSLFACFSFSVNEKYFSSFEEKILLVSTELCLSFRPLSVIPSLASHFFICFVLLTLSEGSGWMRNEGDVTVWLA